MLIKKISIKNFRQFTEQMEIEFASDKKNVTLIIADNGAGKTTLSQAFLWCLYGETSFKNKSLLSIGTQRKLTQANKEAIVAVSLEIEQNNITYLIKRTETYELKTKNVVPIRKSFRISYVGMDGNQEYLNEVQSKIFISKLLPKELSSFFFFGGEKIESMSQEIEKGKSNQFRDAVNGLAGLTATLNAKKHFDPADSKSVYGKFKNDLDTEGDTSINTYIESKQKEQFQIAKKTARIEEIEPMVQQYENLIITNKEKIDKLLEAEKVSSKVKTLEREIENNENSKKVGINMLLSEFSKRTYAYALMPLVKGVLKELDGVGNLDKGIPDMRDTTIKFLLERGTCICGQKLEVGSEAYNAVYSLFDVLPPKNLGQMIGEFSSTVKQSCKIAEGYAEAISNQYGTIRKYDHANEILGYELSDLMEIATDTSEGQIWRKQNEEYRKAINNLNRESAALESEIKNHEKNVAKYDTEMSRMDQISKNNKKIMEYLAYCTEIYNHFKNEYETESEKKRNELQERINDFLKQIFEGSILIELDAKYNIKANIIDGSFIDENNSDMEKSTAQGYAIIFAFISALIEMAKEKAREDIKKYNINLRLEDSDNDNDLDFQDAFPLVMDAPLSVFDKSRIKHLCDILPTIADQVIFFIKDTDGDITEEYLQDEIGMKYILKKNLKESTTVSERIY